MSADSAVQAARPRISPTRFSAARAGPSWSSRVLRAARVTRRPRSSVASAGRLSPAGRLTAVPPSPASYTPRHLAEKILTSRSALEGERKQVTVLFADVKGSMELAEQLDPEEWHTSAYTAAASASLPARRSSRPSNAPSTWSSRSRAARCRRASRRLPTGRCGRRRSSTAPSAPRGTPSGWRGSSAHELRESRLPRDPTERNSVSSAAPHSPGAARGPGQVLIAAYRVSDATNALLLPCISAR